MEKRQATRGKGGKGMAPPCDADPTGTLSLDPIGSTRWEIISLHDPLDSVLRSGRRHLGSLSEDRRSAAFANRQLPVGGSRAKGSRRWCPGATGHPAFPRT